MRGGGRAIERASEQASERASEQAREGGRGGESGTGTMESTPYMLACRQPKIKADGAAVAAQGLTEICAGAAVTVVQDQVEVEAEAAQTEWESRNVTRAAEKVGPAAAALTQSVRGLGARVAQRAAKLAAPVLDSLRWAQLERGGCLLNAACSPPQSGNEGSMSCRLIR
jgi:hypothetical protein